MFYKYTLRTALFLFCHGSIASEGSPDDSPKQDRLSLHTKTQIGQIDTQFWHTTFYDGYLTRTDKLKRAEGYRNSRRQEYQSFIRIIEESRYGDRYKGNNKIQKIVKQCLTTIYQKIESLEHKYITFVHELPTDDSNPKKKIIFGKFYNQSRGDSQEPEKDLKDRYALFTKAQPYEYFAHFFKAYPPVKPDSLIEATDSISARSHKIYETANDLCLKNNDCDKENKAQLKSLLKQIKELERSLNHYKLDDKTLVNFFKSRHKKWYGRLSQDGKLAAITLKYEWTRSQYNKQKNLNPHENNNDDLELTLETKPMDDKPKTNSSHTSSKGIKSSPSSPTSSPSTSPSTSPPSISYDVFSQHQRNKQQKSLLEKKIDTTN